MKSFGFLLDICFQVLAYKMDIFGFSISLWNLIVYIVISTFILKLYYGIFS